MKITPANIQHIGARRQQQDAFAFSNPSNKAFATHAGILAVVADGMGGLANGAAASGAAVRSFLGAYEGKTSGETVPHALERAFLAARQAVDSLNKAGAQKTGSTLAAAVAHTNQLYWLTAGDSRIYLLRGRSICPVNRDHTFGERLLQESGVGRIPKIEAISHPEASHLTGYLGAEGVIEPDRNIRPFRLDPGDCVLLCTDGIYRSVTEKEMVDAFARNPRKGCETIERLILSRQNPNQDNLTLAAFLCEGPTAPAVPAGPRSHGSLVLASLTLALLLANAAIGITAFHAVQKVTAPPATQGGPLKPAPVEKPALKGDGKTVPDKEFPNPQAPAARGTLHDQLQPTGARGPAPATTPQVSK